MDSKGQCLPGHRRGGPRTHGHPGGFQTFYVTTTYVPFLLPNSVLQWVYKNVEIRNAGLGLGEFDLDCSLKLGLHVS